MLMTSGSNNLEAGVKFFQTLGADFVKLGPFFGDQGRTLVVWQKLAKSFLFHARPFEVGRGGEGEEAKRAWIYCVLCAFWCFAGVCNFKFTSKI